MNTTPEDDIRIAQAISTLHSTKQPIKVKTISSMTGLTLIQLYHNPLVRPHVQRRKFMPNRQYITPTSVVSPVVLPPVFDKPHAMISVGGKPLFKLWIASDLTDSEKQEVNEMIQFILERKCNSGEGES